MSAVRRYEIRLFDQTLVEFSIEDGMFAPEVIVRVDAVSRAMPEALPSASS